MPNILNAENNIIVEGFQTITVFICDLNPVFSYCKTVDF